MNAPECSFIIFGISGDLAARKLLPALYNLHRRGELNPQSRIVGFARRDWSDDDLRKEMKAALQKYTANFDEDAWNELAPRLSFVKGAYNDVESFMSLAQHLQELALPNYVFYTATPPGTYEGIARQLGAAKLNLAPGGWSRLVIEKPFGHDLKSAKELNEKVLEIFNESQIYRIDHYLAKETAQNLAALRFANALFEPIWRRDYVDHVMITMAEPMGVEGRGGFYEETGVLRDVFQNHLLQLVALVATEPPARFDAGSVRDEKVKVFRAMNCLKPEQTVIGQYTRNGELKGYREEEGVDPASRQGTFAAAVFKIDNWRWAGVPFFVRSGKRLKQKASEIVLHLKKPPHIPFELKQPLHADRLILRLVPNEGITVRFNAKSPGQNSDMQRVSLDFYYDRQFKRPNPDAYETLILDAMIGDATLFMRADEVEAQWRIVEPLLSSWESSKEEPAFYAAGSWGPHEADDLLARHGLRWHTPTNGDA